MAILLVAGGLAPVSGVAQSLEMQAGNGGPTGNGPTIGNQVVTLRNNTNNPTGDTFTAFTPPVTVTFALGSHQHAVPFSESPTGNAVVFGGTSLSASPAIAGSVLYQALGSVGASTSPQFTAAGGAASGTGISTTANGAIAIYSTVQPLCAAANPTLGRYRMADLTINFSTPVTNPILNIGGLGAAFGPQDGQTLGFSTEFDLVTSGLTLTKLSGNDAFAITPTRISNGAAAPSGSCSAVDDGACGSVRVNGSRISALTLRLFLRGDGQAPAWCAPSPALMPGDNIVVGASLDMVDLSLTKTDGITTYAPGQANTYTVAVANAGPSTATNAVLSDPWPANFTPTSVSCASSGTATCPVSPTPAALAAGLVLPAIASGGRLTFTISGTISASATGSLVNTATVVPVGQSSLGTACAAAGSTFNTATGTCSATDTDTRVTRLTLIKTVTNDNGGTQLATAWTLTATGPTTITGATGTAAVTSAAVNPGTYALTESTTPTGYTAATYSCIKNGGAAVASNSIALVAGDIATCTINNNDRPATLTLVKTVTNDNGGTQLASAWTLTATGPTTITGATGTAAVTSASVNPGTYALTESTTPIGYTAGTYSCVKNGAAAVSGNSIALVAGDIATCTINNNDRPATLTLVKTVTNDNGGAQLPTAWTLTATGPTTISGATGSAAVTSASVNPGTYALTESATPINYIAGSYSCIKNGAAAVSGNSIALVAGDIATCTINNNDTNQTDVRIEKTATPNPVRSGDRVQFTLVVTNLGPAAAHGAVVRDPVAAGLDCTAAALPVVSCSATGGATCPASLTASGLQSGVAIPALPNGGTVTIGLACNVTASGPP